MEKEARVQEERLKEMEQRQAVERRKRQEEEAMDAKRAAQTSLMLNTKGQRQSVGFTLKKSVL